MNYSRQRAEVLDQIREHEDHPTADVIFAELRQKDPSISLATVYRNLKLLSDLGAIFSDVKTGATLSAVITLSGISAVFSLGS